MLIKEIKYTDYDGNERVEKHAFNLTKPEVIELNLSKNGGFIRWITNLVDEQDVAELSVFFRKLILMAYGKKSADGRRFEKSEEMSKEFSETGAYEALYMELLEGGKEAVFEFLSKVMPTNGATKDEIQALSKKIDHEVTVS